MLNARGQVFVTQSALSLQIKRLEDLVQQPVFRREGRRLALTPAGDLLLDYSRRLLSLHDEAVATVRPGRSIVPVRVGMDQDFADRLLHKILSQFHALHPETQVYVRVAETSDLHGALERGALDIIVGFADAGDPSTVRVAPMQWFGAENLLKEDVIPLATPATPCRFRDAAISSIQASGRRYRIAIETPNLSTLYSAVQTQLGLTCRTHLFAPLLDALPAHSLPFLPKVACVVRAQTHRTPAADRFAELIEATIRALPEPAERQ